MTWLLLVHTFQKTCTVAIIWKTSATIENVASQPLAGTVDVVGVEVAIAVVPEEGNAGEDAIKEVVDKDIKLRGRRSTA